ncbi:Cyclin_N domain-containing protein/Cyclin_C domain-containing protein [Gossypium australe]|uniref:Cyclin_N domain-containing protein/Cyclin_C domain-containing protein n=1 Tax=Gossypium australe TaxID=47621 RepID=A0A5B6VPC5_9ROSI|nr:Cyclin_N domain-containing protein/Cyclin_C domain-containing protein [Gossypium australe]
MASLKLKGKTGDQLSSSRCNSIYSDFLYSVIIYILLDSLYSFLICVKGLKIYSQNENPKNEASTMTKPVVGSKAAVLTTAIDSKGSLKNMTKIKGKRDSSGRMREVPCWNGFQWLRLQKLLMSHPGDLSRFAISLLCSSLDIITFCLYYHGITKDLIYFTIFFKIGKREGPSKSRCCYSYFKDRTESNKDVKTSLSVQSVTTKNSDRKSVLTTSRYNVKLSSISDNQESTSTLKEVFTGVEEEVQCPDLLSLRWHFSPFYSSPFFVPILGVSGKAKVCESASHQASYGKNHLSRNRGSDSFVMMATKSGSNSAARILPRSFKPSVKTALRPSNTQRASKSKCSSGLKKQASVAAISSKKDIECTLPANNVAAISSEASQKDLMSNGNSDASINMPDILTRKKAKRRRSYTSLLMTRSKLLEGNGVKEEEKLPGIDKDDNPLEVAQYVDEIYQYYWTTEALNPSLENYMSIQKDITPHMRGILINWLIEVHLKFDLMQETLYLMVTLLDRYLSEVQIKKNEMQLVGLTTLLLASKYEDFWHPRVKDLISISAEAYTSEQMLKMEKLVLKELKFRLNAPTPYVFMLRFIKAAQSDTKLEHLAFYLIELCLVEYEALKFKPSLLCASAIYVARCTLQMSPSWTPLLCRHTRYDASEIRHISFKVLECAERILRFQRAASSGQLKVTFEKYTSPELSQVAMITPLIVSVLIVLEVLFPPFEFEIDDLM